MWMLTAITASRQRFFDHWGVSRLLAAAPSRPSVTHVSVCSSSGRMCHSDVQNPATASYPPLHTAVAAIACSGMALTEPFRLRLNPSAALKGELYCSSPCSPLLS